MVTGNRGVNCSKGRIEYLKFDKASKAELRSKRCSSLLRGLDLELDRVLTQTSPSSAVI